MRTKQAMTKLLVIPGGWKRIPEFPDYVIGPDCRIKNAHTGRPIRHRGGGYGTVQLYKEGKQHERSVRNLFKAAFPGRQPSR